MQRKATVFPHCAAASRGWSEAMTNGSKARDDDGEIRSRLPVPTLARSVVIGALGFCAASLAVFATVAFGERWMYVNLGLTGAYLAWTALFIFLGGAAFSPLVAGRWRFPKFYLLYGIAFFAYAVGWVAAYFALRGSVAGEWLGSLAGSILMALVFAIGFGATRSIIKLSLILFIANSLGYFIGAALNNYVGGRIGMLLWGVAYGLFLGAGIGAVLKEVQSPGSKV